MEDKEYLLMNKEVEELAHYMKLVKRVYLAAIIIIIILFAIFIYTYGFDLFSHFYVTTLLILTIIIMYLLSMNLLFNFRRKVRKLRDKL